MDICEHMEVVDANDRHVGIVQSVEGDRINLIKNDALDPQHPFVDKSQVAVVEDNKVKLSQRFRRLQPERSSPPSGPKRVLAKSKMVDGISGGVELPLMGLDLGGSTIRASPPFRREPSLGPEARVQSRGR
jgi:hypothetical protein